MLQSPNIALKIRQYLALGVFVISTISAFGSSVPISGLENVHVLPATTVSFEQESHKELPVVYILKGTVFSQEGQSLSAILQEVDLPPRQHCSTLQDAANYAGKPIEPLDESQSEQSAPIEVVAKPQANGPLLLGAIKRLSALPVTTNSKTTSHASTNVQGYLLFQYHTSQTVPVWNHKPAANCYLTYFVIRPPPFLRKQVTL